MTEIENVLSARARGLLRGSLAQFLASTDPENAKLVQRDGQLFANFRKLGVRQLDYQLSADFTPERRPKLGATAKAYRLGALVQIGGIDPVPRYSQVGYTFAIRGGRWLLVDDDDTVAADRDGSYEPWELGPIEVARGRGVLVVSAPGEGSNGRRLVREAEAAMPAVQAATRRAPAGVLVVALADRRSFPQTSIGGKPATGIAMPNYVMNADLTGYDVSGSRVVINPSKRKTIERDVLGHEFTHAAMAPLGGNAPTWLVEGYGEYVERQLARPGGERQWVADERRRLRRTAIRSLTVPPADDVFYAKADNYGVGWLIVEYLVNKYGATEFIALYADLAAGRDDPAAHDRTLRKHLKLTEKTLVAAVKKYQGPS